MSISLIVHQLIDDYKLVFNLTEGSDFIKDRGLFIVQFLLINLFCISNFTVAQNFQLPTELEYETDSEEWLHMKLGNDESYLPYGINCYRDYFHRLTRITHTDAKLEVSVISHNESTQAIGISIDDRLYRIEKEDPVLSRQYLSESNSEILLLAPSIQWNVTLTQISEVDKHDDIYNREIYFQIPRLEDLETPCRIPENSTVEISSMIKLIDEGDDFDVWKYEQIILPIFLIMIVVLTAKWVGKIGLKDTD